MPRHLVHYNQRSRRRIDLCRHIICPSTARTASGVTLRRHLTHVRKKFPLRFVSPYTIMRLSCQVLFCVMQVYFQFYFLFAPYALIPSKVKCFSYGTSPDLSGFLCFLFVFDEFLIGTRFISAAFRARVPKFWLIWASPQVSTPFSATLSHSSAPASSA